MTDNEPEWNCKIIFDRKQDDQERFIPAMISSSLPGRESDSSDTLSPSITDTESEESYREGSVPVQNSTCFSMEVEIQENNDNNVSNGGETSSPDQIVHNKHEPDDSIPREPSIQEDKVQQNGGASHLLAPAATEDLATPRKENPEMSTNDVRTDLHVTPLGISSEKIAVDSTQPHTAVPQSKRETVTTQSEEAGASQDQTSQNENSKPSQDSSPSLSNNSQEVHPCKLVRENSTSAVQPAITHHRGNSETEDMAPNIANSTVVHDDLEQIAHPAIVEEKESLSVDADKESVTPDPVLEPVQETDASVSTFQSTRDPPEDASSSLMPPPPNRNVSPVSPPQQRSVTNNHSGPDEMLSPPQQRSIASNYPGPDDMLEATHVMAPPPGTIVYQQPNGEHAFIPSSSFGYPMQVSYPFAGPPPQSVGTATPTTNGRRKITLMLEEDIKENKNNNNSGFFFRRRSARNLNNGSNESLPSIEEHTVSRGAVTVSWFEGTSSSELKGHVRSSVVRKMNLDESTHLVDLRIIDQTVDPPEEIVLSPFIPDGSTFLLRFSTESVTRRDALSSIPDRRVSEPSAPVSPSAAPSPYPSNVDLAKLNAQLLSGKLKSAMKQSSDQQFNTEDLNPPLNGEAGTLKKVDELETASRGSDHHEEDVMGYNPEDQIEARIRQLSDLLIRDQKTRRTSRRTKEKRQVIFVISNYIVLFLSFIAIMGELSARAPRWLQWIETQLDSVQQCSHDKDAMVECLSNGNFAGLVASFILWISRSAGTQRFFLFGFDSQKKLWTVVYESMVTAICWALSYIFIRRGMNPDTRVGFVRKYWKDAVYGSLAGFNAAFLKQVLKNLIPQEALEDALQERQLKILSWLPSFH